MSSNLFGTVLAVAAGLACCVAIAAGAVLCWRWLRPNGQLQPRRYAVVSYTLAALFSALAVVGIALVVAAGIGAERSGARTSVGGSLDDVAEHATLGVQAGEERVPDQRQLA